MTELDTDRSGLAATDKWLLLLAMTVYAAGVSLYAELSITAAMNQYGSEAIAAGREFLFAGYTFFLIVAYAVGFVVLAAVLDRLNTRAPQPLTALSVGLAGAATAELFRVPLLMAGARILMSFQ